VGQLALCFVVIAHEAVLVSEAVVQASERAVPGFVVRIRVVERVRARLMQLALAFVVRRVFFVKVMQVAYLEISSLEFLLASGTDSEERRPPRPRAPTRSKTTRVYSRTDRAELVCPSFSSARRFATRLLIQPSSDRASRRDWRTIRQARSC